MNFSLIGLGTFTTLRRQIMLYIFDRSGNYLCTSINELLLRSHLSLFVPHWQE